MSEHWGFLATAPKDLVALRLRLRARRYAKLRDQIIEQEKADWIHNLATQGWFTS